MNSIRLVLAFKREIFRNGLANLLAERAPNLELLAKCSTGQKCIQKTKELKPDIILLDTEIENCGCVEVTKSIVASTPEAKILILTISEADDDLFSTIKAGARAYISKDVTLEKLIEDIFRVCDGEVIISSPMAEKVLEEFKTLEEAKESTGEQHEYGLSTREKSVLNLVSKGLTNREIASALFISENTVKIHLGKILGKLHVRNRHEAALLAVRERMEFEKYGGF